MTNYRRNFVPGGSYFFTVNLAERKSRLLTDHIDCLRAAFRYARARQSFTIDAIAVLPDHLHAIWSLPEGDADYATRWRLIKASFSRAVPARERISPSRLKKGERGIWQRRYWEHTLRDERDFARHTDYIHFNPVKHGLVTRVNDWPYSSFNRMVRLGLYPSDWGGDVTEDTTGFGERGWVSLRSTHPTHLHLIGGALVVRPMLYQAIISRPELVSLEGLLGNPLDIVVPVVWCAELRTPKAFIRVSPVEVATPDTERPHGTADRPSITMEMEEASFTNGETGTSLEQLGTVHNVNIISTLVSFSSISMFPERKIAKGVTLPASEGYGFVYYHPSQFEAARAQIADKNALIMFDVGMELVTERFPSIVLYTSGFFVNASFDGLPDQDWGKLGAYVRRPLQRLLARGRDSADPRYVHK